jgi:hypothetical protein
MAVGDAAAAAGLKTYTGTSLVNKTHEALNQTGDYIAADRARLAKLEERLNTSPVVILRSSIGQNTSATSNEWVAFRWNVAEFNRGGMFVAAQQTTVTCTKAGVVTVDTNLKFGIQTESVVRVRLTRNGVVVPGTTIDDQRGSAQAEPIAQLSTKLKVNAGDVLTIEYGSERTSAPMRSAECRMTVDYSTLD